MNRKLISGLMASAMLLSALPVTALAADAADVPPANVTIASRPMNPTIAPRPDTPTIAPNPAAAVTRGMFITELWKLSGKPVVNFILPFEDVKQGDDQAEAIRWAASEQIVSGVSETAFAPDAPITREQMATMAYHYVQKFDMGFRGSWMFLLQCEDRTEISDWAYEPMCWMVTSQIFDGNAEKLLPGEAVTAEDSAAMLAGLRAQAEQKDVDFSQYGKIEK